MLMKTLSNLMNIKILNDTKNIMTGAALVTRHFINPSSEFFVGKTRRDDNINEYSKKTEEIDIEKSMNHLNDDDIRHLDALKASTKFTVAEEKKVPTTSLSRAVILGSTGASIFSSYLYNSAKSSIFGSDNKNNESMYFLRQQDADKLAQTLCRMRGAALKLGQTLSIQEENLIPPVIKEAFERARSFANKMPKYQLEQVLSEELGENWRDEFHKFENEPFAAASIGQVHRGQLKNGMNVAVKVQYPGVAESIDSDLNSLKMLISYFKLLPKSFFVDQFILNTRAELKEECQYQIEASKQIKYVQLLKDLGIKDSYIVPEVVETLTTSRVLTTELREGITIDDLATSATQSIRNYVGYMIMENTIEELFLMNFMQTDPNFSNFFFDKNERKMILLDFGAARSYSKEFCDTYLMIIRAAANKDTDECFKYSKKLGFLTGEENKKMLDAHFTSLFAVAEPFGFDGEYDFGSQAFTKTVYEHMPHMMKNRLCPPPQEVYSLHRKLAGAYLINIKLKSKINLKKVFEKVIVKHNRIKNQDELI